MPADQATSFYPVASSFGVRGVRYCEIFVVKRHLLKLRGQIYNTLGLNDCPGAQWSAISAERLKATLHADAIVMNGPRFFMMDSIASENMSNDVVELDGLAMRLMGVLEVPLSRKGGSKPYTDTTIERTTEFTYRAGQPVYELVPPTGAGYVMQSYSHIVDDTLTIESLTSLGDRLRLPTGWRYRVRNLEQELRLRTSGEITVIQDDFQNTYQRLDPKTFV
jgi:haloalkane dehalogenase